MNKQTDTNISPFEFKDELINLAAANKSNLMLNAGRGNPNFLATLPRKAFVRMGEFSLQEAERAYSYLSCGFGGVPDKVGIVERFDTYVSSHPKCPGISFISQTLSFALDHHGISKDDLLFELVHAFLGCNYAMPPRMLTHSETLVKSYISRELCGTVTKSEQFDVFATEGATAAMSYLFRSLVINGLIKSKDKIAIVTPVFSPYLEIPVLPAYDLEIVEIKAQEKNNWQVPTVELAKLLDPDVKILFMVNPSNPPSVKMDTTFLDDITKLVNDKRKDLMIVTDDVYATFADDFRSIFSTCPYNTMCVYSFSKYFGVTGWRLGTMALHHKNVFDDAIKELPETTKKRLDKRYESLTKKPRELKFIDRLVADSRTVALNHTAGLSTPQQLQMTLLAMQALLDEQDAYKSEAKRLIRRRYDILYRAIGVEPNLNENSVDYYKILDLESLAENLFNREFADWLIPRCNGFDFTKRLAQEASVVLLPGKGFNVEHPSARVSLANLTEYDYKLIGGSVRKILDEYYASFIEG